jgi:hypothetical protein
VLETKGCINDKVIYLTAGPYSVGQISSDFADKNDIVMADYMQFSNTFRICFITKNFLSKIPFISGNTMFQNLQNSCDDVDMVKIGDKNYIKTTYFPSAIQFCTDMELPFVTFFHDLLLSANYGSSIWNGSGYNADWKKTTYAETRDYLKEFYTWFVAQLDALNVYWMRRGEYARRYKYLNKYLVYDVIGTTGRTMLYIQNGGGKPIDGLTFRIPRASAPTSVTLFNNKAIDYSYADGVVTLWVNAPANEKLIIEIA